MQTLQHNNWATKSNNSTNNRPSLQEIHIKSTTATISRQHSTANNTNNISSSTSSSNNNSKNYKQQKQRLLYQCQHESIPVVINAIVCHCTIYRFLNVYFISCFISDRFSSHSQRRQKRLEQLSQTARMNHQAIFLLLKVLLINEGWSNRKNLMHRPE